MSVQTGHFESCRCSHLSVGMSSAAVFSLFSHLSAFLPHSGRILPSVLGGSEALKMELTDNNFRKSLEGKNATNSDKNLEHRRKKGPVIKSIRF